MIDPNVLARSIALLILIGLAAWWFFEARGNMKNETTEDKMESALRRVLWFFAVLLVIVCMIAYAVVTKAFAHDHIRPSLDDWFGSLQSQYGTCCGGPKIDATTLDGPHWEGMDGKYRVFVEQQWVQVPDGAVLHQPNKDGRTLVWFTKGYGGIITVRCFMPGSMT